MRILTPLAVSATLILSISACGDNGPSLQKAAAALASHYTSHPPDRGWKVETVSPDIESGKLMVEVSVTSENDIAHIKGLSRMEQFSVAKLACPTLTPTLRAAIGTKARVWVHLKTKKKTLTTSICPAA